MSEAREFSFGDDSVARAYDNVLGPVLFEPWAAALVEENEPWEGKRVLDLATGTGIVAQLLAERVGPQGKVIGTDINDEMLSHARARCGNGSPQPQFIQSPAHPLEVPDESVDVVVCQQGFQFFPDKRAAAREIHRVLKGGGRVIASTWLPVSECRFFDSVCSSLEAMERPEISRMMRMPFDFMPESELTGCLASAGFVNVELRQEERDFVLEGGMDHAVEVAHATPIGPSLRALPEKDLKKFHEELTGRLTELSTDGVTMGRMVSHVVSAEKPA